MVQPHVLPQGERHRRFLGALVRNMEIFRKINNRDLTGLRLLGPRRVHGTLLAFAEYRTRIMAQLLSGRNGNVTFLWDRPDLYAVTWQLFLDKKNQKLMMRNGIDILENRFALLSASSDRDACAAALAMGVADTALEAEDICLGHPGGIIPVGVAITKKGKRYEYKEAVVGRTARRLMDGHVYVPQKYFHKLGGE